MKKIISFVVLIAMFFSMSFSAMAASFSDLPENHWAISYVDALVADGTINGFEDGTFRPNGTVTRAEFVKMIGYGPERRNDNFDDVDASHWAYEYIMTSGLEPLYENCFMPSTPITRGEVAVLLWKRAGSPVGITTPPVIHRQANNYDAINWVYANGIMTGNDNLNLRLSDTLTRAEAAALIVRSRQVNEGTVQTNFYSSVDPKVYETAYNAFGFVDKPYSENATLTNGELAMAAARIISDTYVPTYPGVSATKSFEHPYAQPLNMLCRYYLGTENDNAQYVDENTTVKEAIMALMFATQRSSHRYISYDVNGAGYPGVTGANEASDKLLKKAYQNGIRFDSDGVIDADKEITLKEFAALLVEFDGFSGFYTSDVIGSNSYEKDYKLNTELNTYPANASVYKALVSEIPASVYSTPFINAVGNPSDIHYTTNSFVDVFKTLFVEWQALCYDNGINIEITVNPLLSVKSTTGYTFRVKVKVIDKGSANVLADILNCADSQMGSKPLVNGEEFYVDVDTCKPFDSVVFRFESAMGIQVIN